MDSLQYSALLGLIFISAMYLPSGGSILVAEDSASWAPSSDNSEAILVNSREVMTNNTQPPPRNTARPGTTRGPSLPRNNDPSFSTRLRNSIHRHVNAERRNWGSRSITYDPRLAAIARNHSRDMARRNFIAHTDPDGGSLADRFKAAGYSCQIPIRNRAKRGGGENIFWISFPADSLTATQVASRAVAAWMNSTRHRQNLLNPHWRSEGIGIAVVRKDTTVQVYITQNYC